MESLVSNSTIEMKNNKAAGQNTNRTQRYFIERVFVVLSALGFAFAIVYVYATYSVVKFAYYGYVWNPTALTLIVGFMFVAIVASFLPVRLKRPGDILIYMLFCMVLVPSLVIPPLFLSLSIGVVVFHQALLAFCMLMLLGTNELPVVRIPIEFFTPNRFAALLVGLTLFLVVPLVLYLGLPGSIPGFADVYSVRSQMSSSLARAPGIVGYFMGWAAQALMPFLIMFGIRYKRRSFIGLGMLVALYLYGVTGLKSVAFSVALVLIVYFGILIFRRGVLLLIMPAAVTLFAIGTAAGAILSNNMITNILVNRPIVVPGILAGYYLDFFSSNPKGQWAYSFLSWASDYAYDLTPAYVIGREYFSNPETSANVHMWSDGYANFGTPGVLFITILAGGIVWTLNSFSKGRSMVLLSPIIAFMAYSIGGSALPTSLLTHGVLLILLLVLLSPTESPEEDGLTRKPGGDVSNGTRL